MTTVAYFTPDQEKDRSLFTDPETGVELEVVDQVTALHVNAEVVNPRARMHGRVCDTQLVTSCFAIQMSLVEWFANHYSDFGASLEFITNRSQEVLFPTCALY